MSLIFIRSSVERKKMLQNKTIILDSVITQSIVPIIIDNDNISEQVLDASDL